MPLNNRPRTEKYRPLSKYALLIVTGVLILLLTGCRPPTPAPLATASSTEPTAPQLPTVTPSAGETDGDKTPDDASLPVPLAGLADSLKSPWSVQALSSDELAAMTGGAAVETGTVVARYTSDANDTGALRFTVLLTPRAGLSLDAYLAEVAAALAATGGVDAGGVTVNETTTDYSLRADGVPVALIGFQADGQLFDAPGIVVEGMQAALFDETATNMLVVTITSALAQSDQLQPLLTEIVTALTQPALTE